MYHNSFLESKRYSKLHVENTSDVRNINLAPFIVEGGSVFKKESYFLGSIILGDNTKKIEGQLIYSNGEFLGYNGKDYISFTKDNLWKDGEGLLYTEGQKVGINKINPKKMLEVGGDALVEKKLQVGDTLSCNGIFLGENQGKKKGGMLRYWEGNFEGYDGEKWVKFGGEVKMEEPKIELDLENVQKIGLKDCPLVFKGKGESYIWYDWKNDSYNMGRLHSGNYEMIKRDNLWVNNMRIDGDIIMEKKGTIKNVEDPVRRDEVATKGYVDMVSQGLQNYMFIDFLFLEEDVVVEDMDSGIEVILKRECGKLEEGKLVGILMNERANVCEIIGIGEKVKLNVINNLTVPAKICIREGRYGNSEFFVYEKEDKYGYMQVNGMESLEYEGCILKQGKKVKILVDDIFEVDKKLRLRNKSITNDYLGERIIKGMNIELGEIRGENLGESIIENRHMGKGVINGVNIEEKSLGGKHMRDGFLKNNHFGAGIITERELGNECVGVTNIKPQSILSKHLTKEIVGEENLKVGSVLGHHLSEKIIDSKNLSEGIIMANHLGGKILETRHIGDKVIEGKNLGDKIIEGKHLGEKVIDNEHLGIGVIKGLNISEQSVESTHIRDQSVGENHLMRGAIMDWHIYEGQVRTVHIEDGSITGKKIGNGEIMGEHIGEGAINGKTIRRGAINASHLGMGIIDDKHLVNFSIKGNKLMEGIISETKLAEGCVTTGKIKDKTITNEKMKLPFIRLELDSIFMGPKMVNLGETLSLSLNGNYMIPKRRDGVVEFMGSVRFGEQGGGQKMEINMDMEMNGEVKIGGEKLKEMGEIRGFVKGKKMNKEFLEKWIKCDGKRVRRSDYFELYEIMDKNEEEDEFYLPDIKVDGIDYYVRYSF